MPTSSPDNPLGISDQHRPRTAFSREVTNDPASAERYRLRDDCEAAVRLLRDDTGWDWTYQSWLDMRTGSWHHLPCIETGGARVYLAG